MIFDEKKRKIEKKKESSLVSGVIIGGAVGSILALLFAPKDGKKFRHDIQEKAQIVAKTVENSTKDMRDSLVNSQRNFISQIAKETPEVKPTAKKKAKKFMLKVIEWLEEE